VRSLAGSGSTMFSAHELPFLRPDELEQLRAYSDSRYARLSPEQRERLRTTLHLVLVTLSDADYERVANFVPKSVGM
jgi:hypothetical protein